MIRRIGAWDETITGSFRHPVDQVIDATGPRPLLAAHLNYIEDQHIDRLVSNCVSVAYCPRASDYFGHPHEGHAEHKYQNMLQAGVNVALGTDSILCLNTAERLSVLDDMRFLYRRDGIDPLTLLQMGTVNGARALGLDSDVVTLKPGRTAGVLGVRFEPSRGVDPLRAIMMNDEPPHWIAGPFTGQNTWRA
jgi:cytosine/adenosine deaminase-related metal-dependent hydrolase